MANISIEKLFFLGVDRPKVLVIEGVSEGCVFVDIEIEVPKSRQDNPKDRAYCDMREEDPLCIVTAQEGQKIWAARFDLADSRYEELARAANLMFSGSYGDSLKVTASSPETGNFRWSRNYQRHDDFFGGEFDVGVLFVHGIGGAKRGETLLQFGEPIVKFTSSWLKERAKGSRTEDGDAGWKKDFDDYPCKPNTRKWGVSKAVNTLAKESKTCTAASFDAADTILNADTTREANIPASTLINFEIFDSKRQYCNTTILMAESCWTNTIISPPFTELREWICEVTPGMLAARLCTSIRRALRRLDNDVSKDAKTTRSDTNKPMFRRYAAAWLVVLRSWLFDVPIGLTLCLLLQILLCALGMIAWLPIRSIRPIVLSVIQLLLKTTGLSYVYVRSPVRKAAIRRKVLDDLDWLCRRCQKIVILAHSQGAAIVNDVLGFSAVSEKVKQLITFGSGLKKLSMLDPENDKPNYNYFILAWFSLLALGILLVLGIVYNHIIHDYILAWTPPFVLASTLATLVPSPATAGWIVAFSLAVVSIWATWVFVFEKTKSKTKLEELISKSVPWRDYYASHDPIPDGSLHPNFKNLGKDLGKDFDSTEIQNRASVFSDHTTYVDNKEQFVAPVAFDIIRHSRVRLHDFFDETQEFNVKSASSEWLRKASERRRKLVENLAQTKAWTAMALIPAIALLAGTALHQFTTAISPADMGWVARVTATTKAVRFDFAPIIIILGYYLFETQFILKRRLKESAELLNKCDPTSDLEARANSSVISKVLAATLLLIWFCVRGSQTLDSLYLPQAGAALVAILLVNTGLFSLICLKRKQKLPDLSKWLSHAADSIRNGVAVLKCAAAPAPPSATTPDPSLVETLEGSG